MKTIRHVAKKRSVSFTLFFELIKNISLFLLYHNMFSLPIHSKESLYDFSLNFRLLLIIL